MRRSISFLLAILGSGLLASAATAACGGTVYVESATEAGAPDAPATGARPREAGTEEEASTPPREVTKPVTVDFSSVSASSEIAFEVPANALGFNVVVEGLSPSAEPLGVERITSPSGEVVHDAFMPKGGTHETSGPGYFPIASASVPQNEAASANPPEPGTWRVRFARAGGSPPPPPPVDGGAADGGGAADAGSGDHRARVTIQIGASAGGFVGGRLDLRVYVPKNLRLDGERLDATKAATNKGIERRLETFFDAVHDQLGIDRGDVSFVAAPESLAYIDDEGLLVDGFTVSAGQPDGAQALHVLLTNGIDFGDGGGAWGIAPGIPGAATRTGTIMSGVILAIGDTPAVGDGLTLLHEAGHFFGLNHTTEFYEGYADPLNDTPKCEGLSFEDPSSLKGCPDRMNIMFPAFYGTAGAQAETSEAQRRIYRGSPIYKAYKTAAQGTMAAATKRALVRPGERVSLTKSGRPLTPIESWLSAGLCSHARVPSAALPKLARDERALADLRAAATDEDLPRVMRARAAALLRSATAR